MEDGYIGEIRMFAGNFAPRGWSLCNGQLISISSNTALFSIIGNFYGGDGRTTMGLPDFRGIFPMGFGRNNRGGSTYNIGELGGTESQTITVANMPPHNHALMATTQTGNTNSPQNALLGNTGTFDKEYILTNSDKVQMAQNAIGPTGLGSPLNNMPPFQVVNFIICLQGIFPSRN